MLAETQECVLEIYLYIRQFHKDLNPQVFINVMKSEQRGKAIVAFNSYQAKVLVTTQSGEVGKICADVDFIICFDTPDPSAMRLVQRMRLAKRNKYGHMVCLVTEEGGEMQALVAAKARKAALFDKIRGSFILESESTEDSSSEEETIGATFKAGTVKKLKEIQYKKPDRTTPRKFYLQPVDSGTDVLTLTSPSNSTDASSSFTSISADLESQEKESTGIVDELDLKRKQEQYISCSHSDDDHSEENLVKRKRPNSPPAAVVDSGNSII